MSIEKDIERLIREPYRLTTHGADGHKSCVPVPEAMLTELLAKLRLTMQHAESLQADLQNRREEYTRTIAAEHRRGYMLGVDDAMAPCNRIAHFRFGLGDTVEYDGNRYTIIAHEFRDARYDLKPLAESGGTIWRGVPQYALNLVRRWGQ